MPAKDFLRTVAGKRRRVYAVQTSSGVANAGDIPCLDEDGRFNTSLMPTGIGADVKIITTSEAITASSVVNVWLSSGNPRVRNADATTEGKEAIGFVLTGYSSAVPATVYFEGIISGLSGLVIGATYYVGSTPGTVTATPPTTGFDQPIGVAISATEITFEAGEPTYLS